MNEDIIELKSQILKLQAKLEAERARCVHVCTWHAEMAKMPGWQKDPYRYAVVCTSESLAAQIRNLA
jgi:hypothetical protein